MTMQDYDGADVFDADGNKIGHVERTYVDSSRTPAYAEVKMGALFAKHRLVPLQNAESEDDGIHLPFTKDMVKSSPDVSGLGDGVDADTLSRVDSYYAGEGGDTSDGDSGDADEDEDVTAVAETSTSDGQRDAVPTADPATGTANGQDPTAIRDLGDVVEVPIVEEEIVKRPVVKDVVRIRKTADTDMETVEADVRREDVVPVDDAESDDGDTGGENVLDRVKSRFEGMSLRGEDTPTDPMGGQTYRDSGAPVSSSAAVDGDDG